MKAFVLGTVVGALAACRWRDDIAGYLSQDRAGLGRKASPETTGRGVVGNRGVKAEKTIVVDAPPNRLFRLWRDLEQLPRFMSHLERVRVTGGNRSRWTVKSPAGAKVEWDAEIINEKPGELIAWQALGHPLIDSAGSVRFERSPDGRGTLVHVSLQYRPPGAEFGHAIAALFGEAAGRQIGHDLDEFKRRVEGGDLAV
jgi:uncharacterized membrane protein